MKKGIHPELREITIQMTNGKVFKTMSTYKRGDLINLDIDPHNHPAWTGIDKGAMENSSGVAKYRKKFGSLNLFSDINNSPNTKDSEES